MHTVMTPLFAATLFAALATTLTPSSVLGEAHVAVGYGPKWLDSKDWRGDAANQEAATLQLDIRLDARWGGLACDLVFSRREGQGDILVSDVGDALPDVIVRPDFEVRTEGDDFVLAGYVETSVTEFDLGLRRTFGAGHGLRPFLGGGLAVVYVRHDVEILGPSISDTDSGFGAWAQAGLRWAGDLFTFSADATLLPTPTLTSTGMATTRGASPCWHWRAARSKRHRT